tara:strand:- start:741 stop:1058 length:318 start_codon:yes stop_codon:yes gene_type:complete
MKHNEGNAYTKDYGRNQTFKARHERKRKGIERNLITEKKIKEQIINEWCTCGLCKRGDYTNIKTDKCELSIREITRTCNTLGIPTVGGVVGKWERSQVKRILFGK